MSRQLNLLVPTEAEPAFSARRALIGLGVVLVVFLGYAGWASFGTARLGDSVAQGNTGLAAEQATLKALEQRLGERPKLADILAQIEALKVPVAESQEVLSLLRGSAGGGEGYAAQLAALASVSEEGVWLTAVKIGNAGKTVSLAGRSLRQDSILRYAQHLNERFSAYGAQFTTLELIPEAVKEGAQTTAGAAGPAVSSVVFTLN